MKTLFPLVIDSTMLMKMDSCQMAGFRAHIQHLSKGYENTDLIAGKAFAHGLEVARKEYYNNGLSENEAVDLGVAAVYESYGDHVPFSGVKTAGRMADTLELYFMEYPMATDVIQPAKLANDEFAIEYSFAHELPFQHPDLDMPLIITGRADMLANYAGRLWVEDEKTTGSAFSKDWATQWETRGQFKTYTWGLRKDGIKVAGAFIRGISLQKTMTKFIDTQIVISEWETDIWEQQMLRKVANLLERYKAFKAGGGHPLEYFDGSWNTACMEYFKPCAYMALCRSKSAEKFIESEYTQEIWLPHEQERKNLDQYLGELAENGYHI